MSDDIEERFLDRAEAQYYEDEHKMKTKSVTTSPRATVTASFDDSGKIWITNVKEPLNLNEIHQRNAERKARADAATLSTSAVTYLDINISELIAEQATLIAWAREARELVASIFCQCEPPELPDINPGYQCMRCELLSQLTEGSE